MSRSIPDTKISNPAKMWLQWDSDSKGFKYYDKEAPHPTDATKKGANILIPLPFNFLVLDTLHTFAGFSDDAQAGIYSNEVRDLKNEIINIRIKKDIVASGLYNDIKDKVTGSKYAQSVYIAYFDANKELQIGNIKLVGAAVGPWIEYCKKHKPTEGGIKVASTNAGKKGKVEWFEPIFENIKVKPETDAKAVELDAQLQEYLKQYFNNAAATESTPVTDVAQPAETVASTTPHTDALFNTAAPVTTGGNVIDDEF